MGLGTYLLLWSWGQSKAVWDSRCFGVSGRFRLQLHCTFREQYNEPTQKSGKMLHTAGEIHCHFWAWLPLIQLEKRNCFSVTCKLLHKLVNRERGKAQCFGSNLLPSMCCRVTALCKKAHTALTPGSSELNYVSMYPKQSAETAVFSNLPWKALAVASTAHNSLASWPVKCIMVCAKNAAGLWPLASGSVSPVGSQDN